MTKRLKFFLSIFFLLTVTNSFSQAITFRNELHGGGLKYPPDNKDYIEGTRYLHDNFIKGSIYYDDSLQLDDIPLRLNLHNDALEFLQNDSAYVFVDAYRLDKILLGDDEFAYLKVHPNSEISGYVKVWNNEFPMLITKMKVDFVKEIKGKPFVITQSDHFERADDIHYVMKSEHEIARIISIKKLIKYLENYSTELINFAKNEHVSIKDPESIVRLLKYYRMVELNAPSDN